VARVTLVRAEGDSDFHVVLEEGGDHMTLSLRSPRVRPVRYGSGAGK
jgi:hypothetical protein